MSRIWCQISAAIPALFCAMRLAAASAAKELSCESNAEQRTVFGVLTNNTRNSQVAGDKPARQCILERLGPRGKEYGWSWSWPVEIRAPTAYPELVSGWKPWRGGQPFGAPYPMAIRDIVHLRIRYDVEIRSSGNHNLATSMWLTRTGKVSEAPNPGDIATELMVWTDGFAFDPAGQRIAETRIDGTTYEIWYGKDWGDESGAASNRWNYIAYRATKKQWAATLDLRKFLNDAVERGLASREHFVSSVELGNELLGGSGETWVKSLEFDIATVAR